MPEYCTHAIVPCGRSQPETPDAKGQRDVGRTAPPPQLQPPSDAERLYVAISTIDGAGYGLFARVEFAANAYICAYIGEPLTLEQYNRRYPTGDSQYVLRVRGLAKPYEMVDAAHHPTAAARYINAALRSEDANVRFTRSGGVYALDDIRRHEELLALYGDEFTTTRFHVPQSVPPPPHRPTAFADGLGVAMRTCGHSATNSGGRGVQEVVALGIWALSSRRSTERGTTHGMAFGQQYRAWANPANGATDVQIDPRDEIMRGVMGAAATAVVLALIAQYAAARDDCGAATQPSQRRRRTAIAADRPLPAPVHSDTRRS